MDRTGKHQTKLLQQSGPLKVVGEKIIVVTFVLGRMTKYEECPALKAKQKSSLAVRGHKSVAATIHHSNKKEAAVKLYTKCAQLQIKFRFFCHSFYSA